MQQDNRIEQLVRPSFISNVVSRAAAAADCCDGNNNAPASNKTPPPPKTITTSAFNISNGILDLMVRDIIANDIELNKEVDENCFHPRQQQQR